MKRLAFESVEAHEGKDGKVIQPPIAIFIGRQEKRVLVTLERLAIGNFADECGAALGQPRSVGIHPLPSKDSAAAAEQFEASCFGKRERVADARQHGAVKGEAGH